jgi:hypothetical protein
MGRLDYAQGPVGTGASAPHQERVGHTKTMENIHMKIDGFVSLLIHGIKAGH